MIKELTENIEEMLKRDLEKVQSSIKSRLQGDSINQPVWDPDYLDPTVNMGENVPLDDPNGELQYYKKIRDALEIALSNGSIPIEKMPSRAPCYIQDLAE